ncbi:MAG TPA: gliding motility protein RemB, partial [Salinimicrobium sp.]|nr:gliding motility protein RemB [Salinimicrobium sp.]
SSELHERFPVFPECEQAAYENEQICFKNTLKQKISEKFKLPEIVVKDDYKGEMTVLFEVDTTGAFNLIYVDAVYSELKEELKRVFDSLPKIEPGTYNGRPIPLQFRISVPIPIDAFFSDPEPVVDNIEIAEPPKKKVENDVFYEYDEIISEEFEDPRATSYINIPLSHELYKRFEDEINRIGTNFHSATKPFLYNEVQSYYNFAEEKAELYKPTSTWFGRKLWNEHLFTFQGKNYWFTADFALDLQVGKDFGSELDVTYNNTRAAIFQGGLGKDFNFYAVIYESQGRFADYFNRYAESIRPDGGDPAIIPGRGIAKPFMGQAYDYPVATGYISYSPNEFFNFQLGHGKNFIGNGYRSLLLSDNATPYPYFKLTTTFWKIKYTNTWMSLRDVRPAVTGDGSFRTKYMANHYLSYNITKRLNIGLFESVMWENDNNRGFDFNYLNPVIFYRAIEFSTGARAGNAIIGITGKYKWSDRFNTYGQMIIDEFSSGAIFGGEKSWKNKLGFQLGLKYYHAFDIQNLSLQLEYNQVRPYTYSHNTVVLNYGHNNQSMAHPWGANFRELLGIARYKNGRYYGHVKMIYGIRGIDYNDFGNTAAYGGDIYRSEVDRPFNTGVEIGQGNTTDSFFAQTEVGYIINPSTNLKIYASLIYRNFDPEVETSAIFDNSTVWLNLGIRTDIFNWYFDY